MKQPQHISEIFPKILEKLEIQYEKLNQIHRQILKNDAPFLDIDAASEYLQLSKFTLYGLTSRNLIPFFKPCKKIYFAKAELDAWALNAKKRFKSVQEIESSAITRAIMGKQK
jgi:excisionase family DNA binding protein